jgi:CheY-like chemotaxis protein
MPTTPKPIILVADRNEDAVKHATEHLPAPGATLVHARNGMEALAVINQEPHIAAAVVELELPVVNGFDVIARLTAKQPRPKKIIATTSLDHELLFELAKLLGADAILRKPLPAETWVRTLRDLLPERMDGAQTDSDQP